MKSKGGLIAVAIVAMNVSTYGFQMVSARLVGPEVYGSIAVLLAVLLVCSVLQLGLQATAARRIAAHPDEVAEVEHAILVFGWRSATAMALALALLSPLLEHLLHLQSVYPVLLLALGSLPMNVLGAQCGILQGERRWGALALVYVAAGLPRLLLGLLALAIRPTEGAAMAAVALGWVAPCVMGWWFLTRGRQARPTRRGVPLGLRPITAEVAHSSLALLAFFALSNIDIVMSRHVLSERSSGLYAGGLILTKAVLFLPQFVSVVAFPAMSTPSERRRVLLRALALVAIAGAVCVAGSIVLGDLAMVFVGGKHYEPIHDRLWLFSILGTVLAALQLLVYAVLARQSRRSAWLIWAAVVVLAVAGWFAVSSLSALLVLVAVVDAVLLALLLGLSLWQMRDDPVTGGLDAPAAGSVGGVVPTAPGADTHV